MGSADGPYSLSSTGPVVALRGSRFSPLVKGPRAQNREHRNAATVSRDAIQVVPSAGARLPDL